jgi:hypothetical protein
MGSEGDRIDLVRRPVIHDLIGAPATNEHATRSRHILAHAPGQGPSSVLHRFTGQRQHCAACVDRRWRLRSSVEVTVSSLYD